MRLYKLTDAYGYTRGGTKWGPGITHAAASNPGKPLTARSLCTRRVIHAYTSPLLAVLMNPVHADFIAPKLWIADGIGEAISDGLKVGVKKLTIIREIPLPDVTDEHCMRFAILCAKRVTHSREWKKWADNWLSGRNHEIESAKEAKAWIDFLSAENFALEAALSTHPSPRAARAAEAASSFARLYGKKINFERLARIACKGD